jgi:hypothetical protein
MNGVLGCYRLPQAKLFRNSRFLGGRMWDCSNCQEHIEDDLDVCWNCQTPKNGSALEDYFDKNNSHSGRVEVVKPTVEITSPQPATWAMIQFGFLTRLFGYGGIASLMLGLFVTAITIVSLNDAPTRVTWSLIILAIALSFASLPGLGVLAPPILLLVGILDGVLSLLLRLVSIPLVLFSAFGLLTNNIGKQLTNAGHWMRRHGTLYGRLRQDLAGTLSGTAFSHVADGMLPGNEDGFWGSEGENGPFWILRRHGENMVLMSSADCDSLYSLTRDQGSQVRIVERRRFVSTEVGKLLLAFPQEHALVFPFQIKPEGDPGLTLLIGHEAAASFAKTFYPDNLEVRKLAARTSKIAVVSVLLSFLGPLGLIAGVHSLICIRKSSGWLKGQLWAWFGIAGGTVFTALFLFLLSLGPPAGLR